MDDETIRRYRTLTAGIDKGTSLLTNQDVREAFEMALFPSDAPSVEPDAAMEASEAADDAGHQLGVVNYNVFLNTLEDKLKRKQEAQPNLNTDKE